MKITDLMIGNWVTGKKWREKPFQITRIKFNAKRIANKESNVAKVEVKEVKVTVEVL